jgi:hydroxyacylglutathione hydrolase
MYEIIVIDTPTLGDRSYLVHDGHHAAVVDPQRDIDRVLEVLAAHGLTLGHVFETHVHNDYVSGGAALAALTGATYHVNRADPVEAPHHDLDEGVSVEVGRGLRLRAMATPGHTFSHLAFVLEHEHADVAVFSGGSLLYGSTGRPDLLGAEHAETLARHQHASARRLATEVAASAHLYPTHGFGSFCSSTQSGSAASTVGAEAATNPVLTLDEEAYVEELLAGLGAFPAYYAHMAPANLRGAAAPDLSAPTLADPEELRTRLAAGEWVVDLRHRRAFAAGHLAGTINVGLDGSFATYLGWLIPWGAPLTLLGQSAEEVAQAQRELVRIGIDRPAAAAFGGFDAWRGDRAAVAYRRVGVEEIATAPGRVVLDVRRDEEWALGHLPGAFHIPLHELEGRLAEIPPGEVWVHCQSGYRAAIAASLLARAGRSVVHVDGDLAREGLVSDRPHAAA